MISRFVFEIQIVKQKLLSNILIDSGFEIMVFWFQTTMESRGEIIYE